MVSLVFFSFIFNATIHPTQHGLRLLTLGILMAFLPREVEEEDKIVR